MGDSLTKKILIGLLLAGAVVIAASSPYFAFYGSKKLWRVLGRKISNKNDPRFKNNFYYLKGKGYLNIVKKNHQIYINLTKKGKKRAGKYQIDDLEIKTQKKWDGKYRLVLFDIPQVTRMKRDVLRGKLKELAFYRLQQSVWVCPYPCKKEVKLLQEFFGLTSKELILVEGKIEDDARVKKFFKL